MKIPCPCKDCPERFTACSDRCPKDARGEFGYNAWKSLCRAQKQHFEENRYRMLAPMTTARSKAYKANPRLYHKGGWQ